MLNNTTQCLILLLKGCPPGLQGKLCDKPCPVNCDGACDPRDGKCLFGCKEFYRGRNCNECKLAQNCTLIISSYWVDEPISNLVSIRIQENSINNKIHI